MCNKSAHQSLNLSKDTLLCLLNVLLTTGDLDLGFLSNCFLLPASDFLVLFVIDVNFDGELVPEPIYTNTLSTNNTANVFAADFEFS